MLYQMLTGNIPRGAFKPASVLVHGLDARFHQIVLKAMQVDREERHRSATEMRQHLDTLLMPAVPAPDLQRYSSAQMPKQAAPPERKTRSTSKTPLFIGLGAAAALVIGAVVMFGGGLRRAYGRWFAHRQQSWLTSQTSDEASTNRVCSSA